MGDSRCRRGEPPQLRDKGYVTAEAAMVLPVLVTFTTGLVWALLVAAAQVQCVDAARTGARSLARDDAQEAAVDAARRIAPRGARTEVQRDGEWVRFTVRARSPGPSWLSVDLGHQAVALAERDTGEDPSFAGEPGDGAGRGRRPAGRAAYTRVSGNEPDRRGSSAEEGAWCLDDRTGAASRPGPEPGEGGGSSGASPVPARSCGPG